MRADARQRGYSLVEVLVAFAIVALALTVLLRIFSAGVRNTAVSAEYAHAALVAESRLASADIGPRAAAVTAGTEDEKYHWTTSIRPYLPYPDYTSPVRGLAAYEIHVSVAWPGERGERRIELGTIRIADDGAAR